MERKEGVFGRLVLKDAQQAEYLRSLLRFGATVDDSDSLNASKTIFHQIYFHVSRKEHIVEEIRQVGLIAVLTNVLQCVQMGAFAHTNSDMIYVFSYLIPVNLTRGVGVMFVGHCGLSLFVG
jgi:hypothetical protein